MILEMGSKVLVVHRRLFENDHSRFFLGVVDAYENGVAKVFGHTWIRDSFTSQFFKKEDARTKIVPISSGTLIVYELPSNTEMSVLKLVHEKDGKLILTDGKKFRSDLSEVEHPKNTRSV